MTLFRRRRRSGRLPVQGGEGSQVGTALIERTLQRPEFGMLTFDRLHWIDPTTGELVATPFDWRDIVAGRLRNDPRWSQCSVKSLAELRAVQWYHFLQHHLREDRRLRVFDADGRWLHPISGQWSARVRRGDGQVTPALLQAMSQDLATDESGGPQSLLPVMELERIATAARQAAGTRRTHSTELGTNLLLPAETDPGTDPLVAELRREHERWLRQVPVLPGFDLALLNRPIEQVGGDFHLVQSLADGRHLLVLGDASGHGTAAAAIVNATVTAFTTACAHHRDTVSTLVAVNDALAGTLRPGQFVTCFCAALEPGSGVLEVTCAGHHPGLVGNRQGPVLLRLVGRPGLALGIRPGTQLRSLLSPERVELRHGDTLFAYTDGLCEARNARGQQLGHQGAFASFIGHLRGDSGRIVAKIWAQLRHYCDGRLDDDLSLLVLRRLDVE